MDASGSHKANRAYYDAFSERYEDQRGDNDPGGYHELLDELEADFVAKYGHNGDLLEVGCGTGLVLQRVSRFAKSAKGIDLSPGMLSVARERGLDVVEGSATELPFEDESFDVTYSFKVLAHVPDIDLALSEMARVTRRGGHIIAEFYNPHSIRGLLRRAGPAGAIASGATEKNVYTRFDSPGQVAELVPKGCTLVGARGVRIATPTAAVMRVPVLGRLFRRAEWVLCDTPAARLGGFYVAAMRKN